jgi:hypothetical protein
MPINVWMDKFVILSYGYFANRALIWEKGKEDRRPPVYFSMIYDL